MGFRYDKIHHDYQLNIDKYKAIKKDLIGVLSIEGHGKGDEYQSSDHEHERVKYLRTTKLPSKVHSNHKLVVRIKTIILKVFEPN